ncbi:Alpha/Beta hydrolase protein, partial [Xylariales sp. PMI_506]
SGIGVLLLPGGRYQYIGIEQDGDMTAKWLNGHGFHVWILSYPCADNTEVPIYDAPVEAAKRAIDNITSEKRVERLGIWGWSAGGHLAAITATNNDYAAKLDFMILSYPVISMRDEFTHLPSRDNLLGNKPEENQISQMSADEHVSETSPAALIYHTIADEQVPFENSIRFAQAMNKCNRPFQLVLRPDGKHGVGFTED